MASPEERRNVTVFINGEQADNTLKGLTAAAAKLRNQIANLTEGTEEYKQKMAELEKVNGYLVPIVNDLNRVSVATQKLKEENKGFFDDWKKGFQEIKEFAEKVTLGTIISKGVSGIMDGIGEIFSSSQKEFEEAEKTQAQLAAVLKSTGGAAGISMDQLQKYQQSLMAQTGIDDDVIAKGEEMLLTFTNVGGKIYEKAIPAILDMTSALNQGNVNMSSIQGTAIQVGKALNDPINGMASLRKVGVTFNDQQKEQIKTMQESGNMMGAQTIILQELQKEFGGTAVAMRNTSTGALMAFDTAMGNLKERVGGVIVAVKGFFAQGLTPLVTWLGDTTSEADKLTEAFNNQKDSVSKLEKNTVPLINRYDELKTKGNLNKTEQAELKTVIGQLADTIPSAVTQWDKYGNAMGINTDKARQFIDVQKALLQYQNKDAISSLINERNKITEQRKQLMEDLNQKDVVEYSGGGTVGTGTSSTRKKTDEEIQQTRDKLRGLIMDTKKIDDTVKGLTGSYMDDLADKTKKTGDAITDINKMTVGQLEARITKLNASLQDTVVKSAAYNKITKDIADTQRLLNEEKADKNPNSGLSAAKKAAAEQAKLLKEFESLSAEYKALGLLALQEQLSTNDKQVSLEEEKYNKLIDKEKKYLEKKNLTAKERSAIEQQVSKLELQKGEAVKDLRIRQEQELMAKIKQLRSGLAGIQETEYQKQIDQINKFYDEQQKAAGNNAAQQAAIALNRQQDLSNAEITEKKRLEDEKQKLEAEGNNLTGEREADRLAVINKQYDDEILALKAKFSTELQATQEFQDAIDIIESNRGKAIKKDEAAEAKKKQDKEIENVQKASNQVFSALSVARKAELNQKISQLEKEKEAELSNKNLTEAQKKDINDKYAKLEGAEKLKTWKADQRAALGQAVINGALAVVKALPDIFLAGIAGAAAAVQIGTIATEKPPAYETGGYSAVDYSSPKGYVNRPTLFAGSAARPFIAGEGNKTEYIISSQQLRDPVVADFVTAIEANRGVRRFEAGGYSGAEFQKKNSTVSSTSVPVYQNNNDEIVKELRLTREAIKNQKVTRSYRIEKQENEKMDQITTSVNA